MITATAPGRAGIIGNPTDGYGGTMIACSIKNRAKVTIEKADHLVIENDFAGRHCCGKAISKTRGLF